MFLENRPRFRFDDQCRMVIQRFLKPICYMSSSETMTILTLILDYIHSYVLKYLLYTIIFLIDILTYE